MKQKKSREPEVLIVTDDYGTGIYFDEKAADRLSWILTGLFALSCLPIFIMVIIHIRSVRVMDNRFIHDLYVSMKAGICSQIYVF